MKDLLLYYYGLCIENLVYSLNRYIFNSNGDNYIFKEVCNYPLAYYSEELNRYLNRYKYFSEIMKNRYGNVITVIDGKRYVLLKMKIISNDKMSIFDIKNTYYVNNKFLIDNLNYFNWADLWEKKIDVLEDWAFNKKKQYDKYLPLFNYYIGVSEIALSYLKSTLKNEKMDSSDQLVFSHRRLTVNTRLSDYYDSSELIVDHSSRDIAEYIKDMFYNDALDYDAISEYIDSQHFSMFGKKIFYARLLFPTFFFDNIDKFVSDDVRFKIFEQKTLDFEIFVDNMKGILKI